MHQIKVTISDPHDGLDDNWVKRYVVLTLCTAAGKQSRTSGVSM